MCEPLTVSIVACMGGMGAVRPERSEWQKGHILREVRVAREGRVAGRGRERKCGEGREGGMVRSEQSS